MSKLRWFAGAVGSWRILRRMFPFGMAVGGQVGIWIGLGGLGLFGSFACRRGRSLLRGRHHHALSSEWTRYSAASNPAAPRADFVGYWGRGLACSY